jgi:hypothetical protein
MYLLVFVTLMISIIGLFTQVFALQTARLAAHQSGIGSAMLQWHAAAVSMAVSIIKTGPLAIPPSYPGTVAATGCSLTYKLPDGISSFPRCPSPIFVSPQANAGNTLDGYGTVTDGAAPLPNLNRTNFPHQPSPPAHTSTYYTDDCVHLSSTCTSADILSNHFGCNAGHCVTSYDVTYHQFYSILYQDATTNQDFVVTYLPAPVITAANPAPGYVSTVLNNASLGLTISDLARQLIQAGAPSSTFGYFQNFPTTPQLATTGPVYNLPTTGLFKNLCSGATSTCIANGTIAIISSPDGF